MSMSARTRIHIEVRAGESFAIGGATVTLEHKSGQRARLLVQAESCTPVSLPGRKPTTNPSAQECASSAGKAKEHTHGQYPV